MVSVGGSGVGAPLLRRIVDAYDAAVGAGARASACTWSPVRGSTPRDFPAPPGVEVHGFLPDLDLHHAACDVAVVQGGLSTTMELDRERAGRSSTSRCATTSSSRCTCGTGSSATAPAGPWTTPPPTRTRIADALVAELARDLDYVPVPRGRCREGGSAAGRAALTQRGCGSRPSARARSPRGAERAPRPRGRARRRPARRRPPRRTRRRPTPRPVPGGASIAGQQGVGLGQPLAGDRGERARQRSRYAAPASSPRTPSPASAQLGGLVGATDLEQGRRVGADRRGA